MPKENKIANQDNDKRLENQMDKKEVKETDSKPIVKVGQILVAKTSLEAPIF